MGGQDDDGRLLIRMASTMSQRRRDHRIAVMPNQPALTQIGEKDMVDGNHKRVVDEVISALADMRFLELSPDHMRNPSFPGHVELGDGGQNLPAVLKSIWEDRQLRQTLRDWLRELTPMDVADFEFLADSISGRIQLVIKEAGGRRVSGYADRSSSDSRFTRNVGVATVSGPTVKL